VSGDISNEIDTLRVKINDADRAYYVESSPIMSDLEYDALFDRLVKLEREHPQFLDPNSPTVRVGSDISADLPERDHSVPVLSLDKMYSTNDCIDWVSKTALKTGGTIELVVEPKIDGAGVVLYYENGKLDRALTRGNGYTGNDITSNIRTIKSVPLVIEYTRSLAVRGEVYINNDSFETFNRKYADGRYSNPRNLASGAVRRQKSNESAIFPLEIFIYEGWFSEPPYTSHIDNLIYLRKLGFHLNDHIGWFSESEPDKALPFPHAVTGTLENLPSFIESMTAARPGLPYDIDGLVIKINNLADRDTLGFTQHHPRWAIAYKFESPQAETTVVSISVQVGRAGKLTPVANLEPVELAGSVISRATLHNQDYIDALGLNSNDKVTISKRGDVIPAVEEVIEKGSNSTPFKLPKNCPVCKTSVVVEGAHVFCCNEECPARLLGTLQYFVSRNQMDIETLGDKTLEYLFEKSFIRTIADIYEFDYKMLDGHEGFKEKKISNIITSIDASKKQPFEKVLAALGLPGIGGRVSELLTSHFRNIDNIIQHASQKRIGSFTKIDGIGETVANQVITHFTNPRIINQIDRLKKAGLNFESKMIDTAARESQFMTNTRWVITGSFDRFKPRDKAGIVIKQFGGQVMNSISSKTTHLLCGKNAGSKLSKAKSLGTAIVTEDDFIAIVEKKQF
jgi:DNA ligase (NAD+)